ncbi:MAG: hypothetical protein RI932_274 [Pseudomonadota bacterium]|jgi:hypothetical protein
MRFSKGSSVSLLSILSLTCGVACNALESVNKVEKSTAEVGQKMDETNDGIEETNRKMEEMKREMGEMNGKLIETNQRMEGMNKALDRMYQDLRQGDALAARLQTIEKMSEANTLKGKTVYAAQYFMSFEYQLWKGEGSDGNALREVLKRDAVDEFIQTLRRFSKSTLPLSAMSQDRDLLSLEALALTSHMVNSNAAYALSQRKISISSMHALFRDSLDYGHKLAKGAIAFKDLPEFAQFALREPDLLRYFFELRVNMLPAMVLSEISEVASDASVSRWSSRVFSWLRPWNANLAQKNELELREYLTWMNWANADLCFLKSIGITPRLDRSMLRILKNARLVNQSSAGTTSAETARSVAAHELKGAWDKFLTEIP